MDHESAPFFFSPSTQSEFTQLCSSVKSVCALTDVISQFLSTNSYILSYVMFSLLKELTGLETSAQILARNAYVMV